MIILTENKKAGVRIQNVSGAECQRVTVTCLDILQCLKYLIIFPKTSSQECFQIANHKTCLMQFIVDKTEHSFYTSLHLSFIEPLTMKIL